MNFDKPIHRHLLLAWQILQLALAVLLIYRLRIESSAFRDLALLVLLGFTIHSILTPTLRLPFFLALSIAGMIIVVGVSGTAWIIGIGFFLIALAHLPLRLSQRAAILILAGSGLAYLRIKSVDKASHLFMVMPIIGSMFMFRLAIYLYEHEHEKKSNESIYTKTLKILSYFFLLPNVCFPFFPIVDYKTFCRSSYNQESLEIYQRGLNRILAGIVQILLARFVYHYIVIDPMAVTDKTTLLRYLTADYFLYLKIAGQFDLCIGILLLFGFNLPKTNNYFYFSTSLVDFWRRANIYWKNFMMNLVYYPVYFKVRKLGSPAAVVISVITVFFATCILHSYQWFWIRGDWSLQLTDVLIWSILCLFVITGTLRPARAHPPSLLNKILNGTFTFAIMSILFSMWSSRSLSLWLNTVSFGKINLDWGN